MEQSEKIKQIIKTLDLEPHPEGGYFKETYRSQGKLNPQESGLRIEGERNFSTCIYFLLTAGNFSAFHRIQQDEIWHFYDGAPIDLHIISKEGVYKKIKIGRDFSNGEVPQYVVSAGDWFASEVASDGAFSLAGCTVAPGFDFRDFELAVTDQLTLEYPNHAKIISRLTR
ncbi:cupin domain-containing protein [bacterium SCSIO 12643]|nr:cupin domain-containing protein [bacterium SCSIO 12643]